MRRIKTPYKCGCDGYRVCKNHVATWAKVNQAWESAKQNQNYDEYEDALKKHYLAYKDGDPC